MIITTTAMIDGYNITEDKILEVGEAILGAKVVRYLFASIADLNDGRSGVYESKLAGASEEAMSQLEEKTRALGTNTAVGVDIDYEVVGKFMFMVSVDGTAVMI